MEETIGFAAWAAPFITWIFGKEGKEEPVRGCCCKVLDPIQQAINDILSLTFPVSRCLYPGFDLTKAPHRMRPSHFWS